MKSIASLTAEDEQMALVLRALGNPARVRILREIASRDGCVTGDLVDILPLAQSTVSEHLKVLREAGIIRGTVEGDRCYCLDPEALQRAAAFCAELSSRATCTVDPAVCC